MLDISRLHVLRTVVALGSIRASASALGYTPSAVSQQLAALQRETGLRLFERVGRGIEPTVAGKTLATEAASLFDTLDRIDQVVDDLREGRVGSLSIRYFGSAGRIWLAPAVAALRTQFPDLRLDLRVAEYTSGVPDIDIFVEVPNFTPSAEIQVHKLVDDPYVVVVRSEDPLARLTEVPLADLAPRQWIDNDLREGACRQIMLTACAEAGFSPGFVVETHDYQTAISFVATGIGITVVPGFGIADLSADLVTVPIVSPTPVRHISIAVKKSIAQHPAAQRTVELLRTLTGPPSR